MSAGTGSSTETRIPSLLSVWVSACLTPISSVLAGFCGAALRFGLGPQTRSKQRLLWVQTSGGGGHGALTFGGGGMASSSLTPVKVGEAVFAGLSVAAAVCCNPFGGKLGLHLEPS